MEFEEENPLERARADRARDQDFRDLQDEIAGLTNGRINRFLGDSEASELRGRKARGERGQQAMSQLDQMLVEQTTRSLRQAQIRLDAAQERIDQMRADTGEKIRDMTVRAARLPDGSMVFKDKKGAVRDANGDIVDPVLAETIIWTGNEPSYEEWAAAQDRLKKLDELEAEVQKERIEIGEKEAALDGMSDFESVSSLEDLQALEKDLDSTIAELEADLNELEHFDPTGSENSPAPSSELTPVNSL